MVLANCSNRTICIFIILMVMLVQSGYQTNRIMRIMAEMMQESSFSSTTTTSTVKGAVQLQHQQQQQQQVVNAYPPHIPSFPPDILEIIKSTNSSDYTWLGNHFVPPPGVPVFTPSQIRTYFLQRNILMMGDSTNRRLFGTLRAIVNAEDLDDVKVAPLEEIKRRRRLQDDQHLTSLTSAASVAKFEAMSKGVPDCGPRALKVGGGSSYQNIIGSTAEEYAALNHVNAHSNVDTASSNQTTSTQRDEAKKQRKGFFDMVVDFCYHNVLWDFMVENKGGQMLNAIKEDYDLVIVNSGIWEGINMGACRRDVNSGLGHLPMLLDTLRDSSSKDLQIVFRTPGFALGRLNQIMSADYHPDIANLLWNFTNYSKQFFHNISMTQKKANFGAPRPNMTIVDYGTIVSKRSFGEDRIKGDHIAHYGLGARLLWVQQLMHELIKAEIENYELEKAKAVLSSGDNDA